MADIAIQYPASAIRFGAECPTHIRSYLAGAGGITQSQTIYLDPTTGTALPTDATAAGKVAARGIALNTAGAGSAVDVLENGYVGGFDVSALAFDALVYLSNTVGKLGTTAGTTSAIVGRVAAMSDRDPSTGKPSKVLYFRSSVI
jgi:hypothetical protein